jgi:ribonucleoside-diphosphate reductase alpha chain
MYLDTRSIDDMETVYMEAWKRGLKTTYYLHMKPRHQAEQSTVKVNKSDEIAKTSGKKVGFGFAKKQAV